MRIGKRYGLGAELKPEQMTPEQYAVYEAELKSKQEAESRKRQMAQWSWIDRWLPGYGRGLQILMLTAPVVVIGGLLILLKRKK